MWIVVAVVMAEVLGEASGAFSLGPSPSASLRSLNTLSLLLRESVMMILMFLSTDLHGKHFGGMGDREPQDNRELKFPPSKLEHLKRHFMIRLKNYRTLPSCTLPCYRLSHRETWREESMSGRRTCRILTPSPGQQPSSASVKRGHHLQRSRIIFSGLYDSLSGLGFVINSLIDLAKQIKFQKFILWT